ncbi:MFS transporter [Sporomusa sphaeroides]|uniref:MFS transporter n=1 Tax=Sporomusa sphaeroides TaxID=47679 RepID=UPI003DA1355F
MENKAPTNVRNTGLALVFLMTFICLLDRANYGVCTSSIMKDLNLTVIEMGQATTVFSLAYAVMQIPGSIIVRRYGTRAMIALSVALWSLFTLATGFSTGFLSLVIARMFFGFAEAPVFPATNKYNLHWFPQKDRAFANSIPNAGSWLALIIAPPLMVWLLELFGWRWVFYLCAGAGFLGAALWYWLTRNVPEEHPGVNQAELAYIQSGEAVAPVKHSGKIPWGKFFRSRSFWCIAVTYFCSVYMLQYFVYWLPFYLQNQLNMSIKTMGYAASIPWIFIFLAGLSVGRISDWLFRHNYPLFIARNGLILLGFVGSAIFMYISTFVTDPWTVVLLLSFSLGFIGFNMTIPWAIASDIGGEFTGIVSSWMNNWGQIGAAIMATLSAYIGIHYGWNSTLLALVVVACIGIVATLGIRPEKKLM